MRIKLSILLAMTVSFVGLIGSPATAATVHWVNDDDPNGGGYAAPGTSCTDPGYATVQAGVNAAASGDTIRVCGGTYAENVTVDTPALTIRTSDGLATVAPASGNALTLGMDADGLAVHNLRVVSPDSAGLYTNSAVDNVSLRGLRAQDSPTYGINIHNSAVINDWDLSLMRVSGNGTGMRIRGEAYGLTIREDSRFNGNKQGLSALTTTVGDPIVIDGLDVSDSQFNDNTQKGMYFEALSNSTFEDIEVLRNGFDVAYNAGAGLDINLKHGDYENITIQNSGINENGHPGATFGGGLTIKARDDAPYNAAPATLDGVWVLETDVSANSPVGIRFGEPGKSNAGPTDAHVNLSSITENSGFGLENASDPETDGTCNWWGSSSGPGGAGGGTGDEVSTNVAYAPWETTENGPCDGTPPPPPNPPSSKDDCKKDGWMTRTDDEGRPFKNQGDCVSYFATGGKNKAAG